MFNFVKKDRERGFSLVELIVVVVIIGILAGIAIPLFSAQRNRAYKASAQEDGRTIALEMTAMLNEVTNMGTTPAAANTFVGVNTTTGVLTLTFNGTPQINGVNWTSPQTSTIRVSPGTTITTSGYSGGAVATPGNPTWCVAVDNNGQKAVYTNSGLSTTATACSAAGAAS